MVHAIGKAGVIRQIFVNSRVVIVLFGADVLHERHHGVGIIARARHQQQAVFVRLQFVAALHLRDDAGLCDAAEVRKDRREDRGDAEDQIEDLSLRGKRHGMTSLVVARLVTDHACQFVVGLNEVEQALVHVDVTAADRERIDVTRVENLDVVRHVVTSGLRPDAVADLVDPLIEQRVGDDTVGIDDGLVLFMRLRDLRGGRLGTRRRRDGIRRHRQ